MTKYYVPVKMVQCQHCASDGYLEVLFSPKILDRHLLLHAAISDPQKSASEKKDALRKLRSMQNKKSKTEDASILCGPLLLQLITAIFCSEKQWEHIDCKCGCTNRRRYSNEKGEEEAAHHV